MENLRTLYALKRTFGHWSQPVLIEKWCMQKSTWRDMSLTLFSTPTEPIPRYADIARYGSRYAVAGAVIGSLIGFMQLLWNLDCPSRIGVGLAVTFLPILYGLLLSEIVFAWLYKAYADGDDLKPAPPLTARTLVLVMVVVGILIAMFLVMLMVAFAHLAIAQSFDLPGSLSSAKMQTICLINWESDVYASLYQSI